MNLFFQIYILITLTITTGLVMRHANISNMNASHNDGCLEAALKLKKDTGNTFLYGFCEARDQAIREYGER